MAGIAAVGRALLGNVRSCMYFSCGPLACNVSLLGVAVTNKQTNKNYLLRVLG